MYSSNEKEEHSSETYHALTESNIDPKNSSHNQKWTWFLMFCCLSACTASFQFGFNIGSTNLPANLIQNFFGKIYYPTEYNNSYLEKKELYSLFEKFQKTKNLSENFLVYFEKNVHIINKLKAVNITVEIFNELYNASTEQVNDEFLNVNAKINKSNMLLWTITNCCFVVGGMLGAFTSKYIVDYLGRKNGIIFHNFFTVLGSFFVIISRIIDSPVCVILSRFFFGVQGGMMCGIIPTYLNEISPKALRGSTGVLSQLCITVGILIAQTLGFRQFLGTKDHWHILLALPILPSLIGSLSLLMCFPESPKVLINRDEDECRKALQKLRNTLNVGNELDQIKNETRDSGSEENLSIFKLIFSSELRWPLITGLVLNLTQQLCGINAVFFYSGSIFSSANIQDEHIQYAVFATGLINVIFTIVVVPLIDKLGRKPLLVYPMILMIIDFLLLTVCLILKERSITYSYLSIFCIIVFIMCFAVGLGPIPFLYVAECFRQESRSAALAICMFANWVANLVLTLAFPYMNKFLSNYVFLVFTAIVAIAVLTIISKVPETKGRNVDEIMNYFDGKKSLNYNRSRRDIQLTTNPRM